MVGDKDRIAFRFNISFPRALKLASMSSISLLIPISTLSVWGLTYLQVEKHFCSSGVNWRHKHTKADGCRRPSRIDSLKHARCTSSQLSELYHYELFHSMCVLEFPSDLTAPMRGDYVRDCHEVSTGDCCQFGKINPGTYKGHAGSHPSLRVFRDLCHSKYIVHVDKGSRTV